MKRWKSFGAGFGAAILSGAMLLSVGGAQAQIAPGGGPMDITADRFDLYDAQKMATYKGRVEILQGQNRMRADQVNVFYRSSSPAAGPKPAPGAAPAGAVSDIDHLEATGNVYFVTPTQTVRGDKAVYTQATDTILVTGNVVLAQGENVMRGERLTVQVKAGTSQMDGGRVRALVYPDKKQ